MCGNNIIGLELLGEFALHMVISGANRLAKLPISSKGIHQRDAWLAMISITRQRDLRRAEPKMAEDPEDAGILTRDAMGLEASNPSDKIYRLLGLIKESIRDAVTVDYDLPPAQAFVNFAKAHFPSSRYLWFLHRASVCTPITGLPSWCPNFDEKVPTDGFLTDLTQFGCRRPEFQSGFGANKKAFRDDKIAWLDINNHLHIPGFRVDTVDKVVLKK